MKKRILHLFIVSILLTAINLQTATAQSWNVTGNNNATSSSKFGTTNFVPLKFFTNNSQRMVIDSLGKVGVGITNPVNIFTVKSGGGTPTASWLNGLNSPVFVGFGETVSSELLLAGASNTAINRAVFQGRRSRGTLAAPAVVANNDYITSLLASAFDGSTFQNPALVSFFVDGTPSSGNVPTRISLITGSNAGNRTERLKVGSTGNFDFNNGQLFLQQTNGNLGIGTITPTYPLDLRGSSSTTQIRLSYPSNGGPYFASIGFSDPNQGLLDICARMDMGFESLSGNSNSYIAFRTGQSGFAGNNDISTERMRVSSSGNVGIGTISPASPLHIVSGISNNSLEVTTSGTSNDPSILLARNSGANDKFQMNVRGVSGSSWLSLWDATNGSVDNGINIKGNNVGIGTSSPGYKLDVVGRMRIRNGNGSAGTWFMNAANTIDAGFVGMLNDNYVGLYGTGIGWGFIMNTTSGNVGIGTFTPAYKLDVCGTIRAKELRVETGWCDYVFEKNYKLKSIEELEQFINENKHLPGVTAASEVEKEGLKVAEMNKAMMEKIEELTLYVIQLSKENKKLQQEIESLKK